MEILPGGPPGPCPPTLLPCPPQGKQTLTQPAPTAEPVGPPAPALPSELSKHGGMKWLRPTPGIRVSPSATRPSTQAGASPIGHF